MVTGSMEVPKKKKLIENYICSNYGYIYYYFSNEIKKEGVMKAKLSFVYL